MADRHTLSLSKIPDFKIWLVSKGWEIENCKGTFEILRARHSKRKNPLIIYKRIGATEHATIQNYDFKIVMQFLNEQRKKVEK